MSKEKRIDLFGMSNADRATECFQLSVMAKSGSEGIEIQETIGQQRFVNSASLPVKIQDRGVTRDNLEKCWGVKFLKQADDLFVKVELPEGWKVVPTDHSMWSNLHDDKDRVRASIFYKAAFYDRDAFMGLDCRFKHEVLPEDEYKTNIGYEERSKRPWFACVKDGGKIVWKTDLVIIADIKEKDKLRDQATTWLEEHYPQWQDHFAYWENA